MKKRTVTFTKDDMWQILGQEAGRRLGLYNHTISVKVDFCLDPAPADISATVSISSATPDD